MAWFDQLKTPRIKSEGEQTRVSKVPEGLWVKCEKCSEIMQSKALRESWQVCPSCSFHMRLSAEERLMLLCDRVKTPSKAKNAKGKKGRGNFPDLMFEEYGSNLASKDPLEFDDVKPYRDRLLSAAEKTGIKDAFIAGRAVLGGLPYHIGIFEFKFLGGSMGVVVGEKVALVFEHALKDRLPAVIVSASGGARMQEGILSLMQMAKTTALIEKMKEQGIPYISVLTDPTTGGVAASFAMLGDIILAEPNALIGFAGPRVIQQTIRQSLPQGFQRSEFLLKHGFVDRIVQRGSLPHELRTWMHRLGRTTCRFPEGI